MRSEAMLVYGVPIEGTLDDEVLEYWDEKFTYSHCGYYDASERYIIYDPEWAYKVEWDEVQHITSYDLEAAVDVVALCKLAKSLGCENPEPGWYLVAYYG